MISDGLRDSFAALDHGLTRGSILATSTAYGGYQSTTTLAPTFAGPRVGTPERQRIVQDVTYTPITTTGTRRTVGAKTYTTGAENYKVAEFGTSGGLKRSVSGYTTVKDGYRTSGAFQTGNTYTTTTGVTTGSITGTTTVGGVSGTRVSSVRTLEPRVIGVNTKTEQSHIIAERLGEKKFVEERYVGERVIGVSERALEERIISTNKPEMKSYVREIEAIEEEPIIKERIVEKPVEVIVEKKVQVKKYVDVEYEVVVEKPIEKIIEKEIEIEKIMEKEIERIVEVPVEKIVEIPVEKIVEVPVEIEKRVEVPVEKVIEREVQDIIENVIYHDTYKDVDVKDLYMYPNAERLPTEVNIVEQERIVERPIYRDNIIEKVVDIPFERIIEVPVQKVIEKPVEHIVERPVYIDNIIETVVEIPVEKVIEKPVEKLIEKPIYIENIIEKPIPIEVVKEQVVEQKVEHVVEKPVYVENIIEKYIDNIIENPVPIEQVIQIPTANYVDYSMPVDRVTAGSFPIIQDKPMKREVVKNVPIEYIVSTQNPVAVENLVEIQVPNFNTHTHEKIIDKEVVIERIIERPVEIEQLVEVEIPRERERPIYVEKIVEKPIHYDQVIEEKYEVLVPNVVEVPIEKEIRVPVKTTLEQPVEYEQRYERDYEVDAHVTVPVEGRTFDECDIELDDADLDRRIIHNRSETQRIATSTRELQNQISQLRTSARQIETGGLNSISSQNANLRAELHELKSRVNLVEKDKDRLRRRLSSRNVQVVDFRTVDPHIGVLQRELDQLLSENHHLMSQVDRPANPALLNTARY